MYGIIGAFAALQLVSLSRLKTPLTIKLTTKA